MKDATQGLADVSANPGQSRTRCAGVSRAHLLHWGPRGPSVRTESVGKVWTGIVRNEIRALTRSRPMHGQPCKRLSIDLGFNKKII